MPYKDRERQKEAQKSYYENAKDRYKKRSKLSRNSTKTYISKLKNGPCVDCGLVFPECAMDFDHVNGSDKLDNISSIIVKYGRTVLEKELSKCELVCANCHRLRTQGRRDTPNPKRVRKAQIEKYQYVNKIKDTDCGKIFSPQVMNFDHIDSYTKVDNIGRIINSRSWEILISELTKCELVCVNCHRIRTKDKIGKAP